MGSNPTERIKRYSEVEKRRYLDENYQEQFGKELVEMSRSGEVP
jgi:hypothetical protein